jgi:hypothetical protein
MRLSDGSFSNPNKHTIKTSAEVNNKRKKLKNIVNLNRVRKCSLVRCFLFG